MLFVIALWILLSLLVGYLGQRGRAGFWGAFLFSILVTPVVGALGVMLLGPSGAERKRYARSLRSLRRSGATGPRVGSVSASNVMLRPIARTLLLAWAIMLIAFAAAISLSETRGGVPMDAWAAFMTSLDAGTFGMSGVDTAGLEPLTRVLVGLERVGFVLLLVFATLRLTSRDSSQQQPDVGDSAPANQTDHAPLQSEPANSIRPDAGFSASPPASPATDLPSPG